MTDGIFLSSASFGTFSPSTQAEILNFLRSAPGVAPTVSAVVVDDCDDGPADLSENQVRRFLERCSGKTIAALQVIADSPATGFRMKDVGKALGVDLAERDIRGVWSGLTRRTRTVLDNPKVYLIGWDQLADEWVGWVSPATHRALRKVLAKRKG